MNFFRKKIIIVYCFSFLPVIAAIFWFYITTRNLPKYDYTIDDWRAEDTVYTDRGITAGTDIKDSGSSREFLWGPFKPLRKGSYTAVIDYSAEQDQSVTAAGTPFSTASTGILSRHLNSVDYQFEVREDVEEFDLVIFYNGTGEFSVKSVTILANNRWNKRITAEILFSIIFFDILFYLYTERKRSFHTLMVLLGITAVSALPLASHGIHYGHDIAAHLLRIEAVFQALRFGQFPARISSITLFGLGYPFSIYYNDLFLYFPAFLRFSGFSVIAAYKAYVFAVLLLTSGIAYYSFKNIFGSQKTGFILALVYTTASYHFVNLYVREAVGEYTAQTFLPLLALAFFRIYSDKADTDKNPVMNSILLTAGLSGIIGSHILTVIMTLFLMLIVCLMLWKKTFTKNVLLTFALSAGLTVILNLYFIIPFADYYFNVPTIIKSTVDQGQTIIQNMGVQPAQLFSFFQNVVGFWDQTGQDRMQCTPGLPLMAVLGFACFRRYLGRKDNRFRLILFLSVFTLFISTDIFPWDWMSYRFTFWSLLAQIQFPCRFLIYSVLFLTLLTGEILQESSSHLRIGLVSAALVMYAFFTGSLFDHDRVFYVYDTSGVDPYKTGFEYYLQGTDWNAAYTGIIADNMEKAEIVSRTSNTLQIYCRTDRSGQRHEVFVPVYNYKGYHVNDESGKEYEIINGAQNHLGFALPDDFDGVITVQFRDPFFWTAGLFVSLLSALFLFPAFIIKKNFRYSGDDR